MSFVFVVICLVITFSHRFSLTAPSPVLSHCTWKDLYRQAWWYDTKLPLPRGMWDQRHESPWMEALRDCCLGGNWLGVRRLCATHEYKNSMFNPDDYHPLTLAARYSVDCLRIFLVEHRSDPHFRVCTVHWTLMHIAGQSQPCPPLSS